MDKIEERLREKRFSVVVGDNCSGNILMRISDAIRICKEALAEKDKEIEALKNRIEKLFICTDCGADLSHKAYRCDVCKRLWES
jgi:ribosomal protein L40E